MSSNNGKTDATGDTTAKVTPDGSENAKKVKVWGRIFGSSQHGGEPVGGWTFPVLYENGKFADLRGTAIMEAGSLFPIATLRSVELMDAEKVVTLATITPKMVKGDNELYTLDFAIDANGKLTKSEHSGISTVKSQGPDGKVKLTKKYDQRVNFADNAIGAALEAVGLKPVRANGNGAGNSALKELKALVEEDSEEQAIAQFLRLRAARRATLALA